MSVCICGVEPGSIAEEMNVVPGSRLLRINGRTITDSLDYLFMSSDDNLEVEIEDPSGEVILFDVEKDPDEDLGFIFESGLMDEPGHCANACVFCFVDQLPKGLRSSLYFKDDDTRLSFLQGNFVTLTNVTDAQLERIVEYGIHPINVSVHSLDPQIRMRLMKNPKSAQIHEQLSFLVNAGVSLNGQIVLVPGYNDGEDLLRTIEGLYALGENFLSVAVVPVGLTAHREGLSDISPLSKADASEVIDSLEPLQNKYLEERGTSFVFLADEFYLLADRKIPEHAHYEGYLHYEDGIGMIRRFVHEMRELLKDFPSDACGQYVIATGTAFAPIFAKLAQEIEGSSRVKLEIVAVENRLLGGGVNVSALLSYSDIVSQIQEDENRTLILSRAMYNINGITLDGKKAEDFAKVYRHVRFVEPHADALLSLLKEKRCLNPLSP